MALRERIIDIVIRAKARIEDLKNIEKVLEDLKNKAKGLKKENVDIPVEARGVEKAEKGLESLEQQAKDLETKGVDIPVEVRGVEKAEKGLEDLKQDAAVLKEEKIALPVEAPGIEKAEKDLEELRRQAASLERDDIDISVFATGAEKAEKDLEDLKKKVAALDGEKIDIPVTTPGLKKAEKGVTGLMSKMKSLFSALGGWTGVVTLLIKLGKDVWKTTLSMQRLNAGFKAVFGSAGKARKELDYVRKTTNKLGLEFKSSAAAYLKFADAAKDTKLENEGVRELFEATGKAAAVLGLNADETAGILKAFKDMLGKNKVEAGDLKDQVGDKLPGAFRLAARAMGVTTEELGKLMADGKVLAEDLLPKLAKELEREYGKGAAKAANESAQEFNRLKTAWYNLRVEFGNSGFLTIITTAIKQASDATKFWADQLKRITDHFDKLDKSLKSDSLEDVEKQLAAIDAALEKLGNKKDELEKVTAAYEKNPGTGPPPAKVGESYKQLRYVTNRIIELETEKLIKIGQRRGWLGHEPKSDDDNKKNKKPPAPGLTEATADMVFAIAKKHGVDPRLVLAVIKTESNFDPKAKSPKGAVGLMQLMPGTAADMGVTDITNPAQNVEGGVKYLKMMLDRYAGDVTTALAAYNAGPAKVDQYGGALFPETRKYTSEVMKNFKDFGGEIKKETGNRDAESEANARIADRMARARKIAEKELRELEILYEQGQIKLEQYFDERKAILEQKYEEEIGALGDKLAMADKPAERIAAQTALWEAEKAHEMEMLELERQRQQARDQASENRAKVRNILDSLSGESTSDGSLEGKFEAERQALEMEYAERRQMLQELLKAEEDTWIEKAAMAELFRNQELAKERLAAKQKKELLASNLASAKAIAGGMADAFGSMYELTGKKMKAFFILQKAASLAEAIINIQTGITAAWKMGPYLGPIMAAIVAAKGAASIATIAAQTFAAGGIVPGKSPHKRADNILARLTAGEYVHSVDTVNHYGPKVMEAINKRRIPKQLLESFEMPGLSLPASRPVHAQFADGGLAAPEPVAARGSGQGGGTVEFHNVNVLDPMQFDRYLASSAGAMRMLNFMSENAPAVAHIIREKA